MGDGVCGGGDGGVCVGGGGVGVCGGAITLSADPLDAQRPEQTLGLVTCTIAAPALITSAAWTATLSCVLERNVAARA